MIMNTKQNETIFIIRDVDDLNELDQKKEYYAAERICRSYMEDFVNEDNGEVVTIERKEAIFEKGQKLYPDDFSVLLFHFQSGDLKEAILSDQQRQAKVDMGSMLVIWNVKAANIKGKPKLNMLLFAENAQKAYQVAQDYIELNYIGIFLVDSIKKFDQRIIIEFDPARDDSEEAAKEPERQWYDITSVVTMENEEYDHEYCFIVYADNTENAKKSIENYLVGYFLKREITSSFVVKIKEAKMLGCNVIVPMDFCMAYKEESEEE